MRFGGKVAVVTGASSGIGEAIAKALVCEGARVLAVGGNNVPRKEAGAIRLKMDLALAYAPKAVVEHALAHMNAIDIVVNAAGTLSFGRVDTTTDDDWQRALDVNLSAAFRMMRAATGALRESKGCVVNVSSINSYRPFANTLAYSVSKAGMDQLTRVAAVELAMHGIRVNAVNPGVVVTNLHRRAGASDADYATFIQRCKETHPLGRPGAPEDIVKAVLFLAEHEWMTGVCLPVDGGRHLTVVR